VGWKAAKSVLLTKKYVPFDGQTIILAALFESALLENRDNRFSSRALSKSAARMMVLCTIVA